MWGHLREITYASNLNFKALLFTYWGQGSHVPVGSFFRWHSRNLKSFFVAYCNIALPYLRRPMIRWCYTGRFATTISSLAQHSVATLLQHCFNIVPTLFQHCWHGYNIVPTLQRCVAPRIVAANSAVQHHRYWQLYHLTKTIGW